MKKLTIVLLLASHIAVGAAGFALGIYVLPILIAPEAPTATAISQISESATYTATFQRDLKDSDALHWGEGEVFVAKEVISFMGELAPGPDYKLYLSPEFVETEADFNALKSSMIRVGNVDTFENFIVSVPNTVDPSKFNSVIVWCETFGEFITAAKYK